jgi:hypothetical protein
MKIILLILALSFDVTFAQGQVVKPRVGSSFGEVLTVEVEFVEKRRTYIEQNIVKEPWLAKVVSVNGVELETPVIIEYILIEGTVNKGIKYSFLAFEDIYRLGSPRGWSEEVSQIDYHLRQRLFLKPLNQKQKKEANKSEMATPRKPSD